MSYAPTVVLRALLAAKGLVTLPAAAQAWPCYMVNMPDGENVANDVACVYDVPGLKDGRLMSGPVIEMRSLQVKIRAAAYQAGTNKAHAIAAMFDNCRRVAIKAGGYVWSFPCIVRDPVYPIGQEYGSTKRRFLWTLNFGLHLSEYGPNDPAGAAALANALEVIEVDLTTYFGSNSTQ